MFTKSILGGFQGALGEKLSVKKGIEIVSECIELEKRIRGKKKTKKKIK